MYLRLNSFIVKCICVDSLTVLDDLMFKSCMQDAVLHHTCPESDAESGILPVLALNQMTDSHLMEASLSKQTQYTPPLLGPPPYKEEIAASSLQGYHSGPPSIESIV